MVRDALQGKNWSTFREEIIDETLGVFFHPVEETLSVSLEIPLRFAIDSTLCVACQSGEEVRQS